MLVDTLRRELRLCRGDRAEQSFAVAVGREGIGKRIENDGKTPGRGEYVLSPWRNSWSDRYIFIGLGYPTADQKRNAYTGSEIGIHGPPKGEGPQRPGDWTKGCIATLTPKAIYEIRDWIVRHDAGVVEIWGPDRGGGEDAVQELLTSPSPGKSTSYREKVGARVRSLLEGILGL